MNIIENNTHVGDNSKAPLQQTQQRLLQIALGRSGGLTHVSAQASVKDKDAKLNIEHVDVPDVLLLKRPVER